MSDAMAFYRVTFDDHEAADVWADSPESAANNLLIELENVGAFADGYPNGEAVMVETPDGAMKTFTAGTDWSPEFYVRPEHAQKGEG